MTITSENISKINEILKSLATDEHVLIERREHGFEVHVMKFTDLRLDLPFRPKLKQWAASGDLQVAMVNAGIAVLPFTESPAIG